MTLWQIAHASSLVQRTPGASPRGPCSGLTAPDDGPRRTTWPTHPLGGGRPVSAGRWPAVMRLVRAAAVSGDVPGLARAPDGRQCQLVLSLGRTSLRQLGVACLLGRDLPQATGQARLAAGGARSCWPLPRTGAPVDRRAAGPAPECPDYPGK